MARLLLEEVRESVKREGERECVLREGRGERASLGRNVQNIREG